MAHRPTPRPPDRLFTKHGRKHFRKTWSTGEARVGAVILVLLAVIAGWIAWLGQHPDPSRLVDPSLLAPKTGATAERGPLPEGLATAGYTEGDLRVFGPDNLFEKINGRADFFKARGFRSLVAFSLNHPQPEMTIDLEVYDMGGADAARGTYMAEKSPEAVARSEAGTTFHAEANALFLARGSWYVRAVAATGGTAVTDQLAAVRVALEETIEAAEAPWSQTLFVDRLGLDEGRISFHKENAFSFGFATEVHVALLDDDETELWVTRAADDAAATALAQQFIGGFTEYGESTQLGERTWVVDRYLGSHSTAVAVGSLVVGVRAAPTAEVAQELLPRLLTAVGQMQEGRSEATPALHSEPTPSADESPSPVGESYDE